MAYLFWVAAKYFTPFQLASLVRSLEAAVVRNFTGWAAMRTGHSLVPEV